MWSSRSPKAAATSTRSITRRAKVFLDRYLYTAFGYPADYGYADNTLGEGRRPARRAGPAPESVYPVSSSRPGSWRCTAMSDEAGGGDKLLAVPAGDVAGVTSRTSATSVSSETERLALLRALQGPRSRVRQVNPGGWVGREEAEKVQPGRRASQKSEEH